MSTINPMAIVRPFADGIMVMAMMSAMSTMMTYALAAETASTASTIAALGAGSAWNPVPYGSYLKKPKAPVQEPKPKKTAEKTEEYNPTKNLSKLVWSLKSRRKEQITLGERLKALRKHRAEVMREYNLTIIPPTSQMKNYPHLLSTELAITRVAEQYKKNETSITFLMMRIKDVRSQMGKRPYVEVEPQHYPVTTKKYVPEAKDIYSGQQAEERY